MNSQAVKYKKYMQALIATHDCPTFCNGEKVVDKNGDKIEICLNENTNCWKNLGSLELGRCGELYAQYLLSLLGCEVYEVVVDNRGIDLLAKHSSGFVLKVQVKTVRDNNYAFIRDKEDFDYKNFFIMYIKVSKNGKPSAFLFPMKYIKSRLDEMQGNEKGVKHFMCFSHRGKDESVEYGISAYNKHYKYDIKDKEEANYYQISENNDILNNNNFNSIIKMQ